MKATLIVFFILLGLCGCHSTPKIPIDDTPKLPTQVEGASDPYEVRLYEKLKQRGVHVITMGQEYLISIPSTLIFATESPRILWESYDILNDVVCYLKQFRKIEAHVDAYASCYVSDERVHALTLARARSIADYLWSQDIESRMIFAQGGGDKRPIVNTNKCTDTSPNSRIEITFRRAVA